MVDVANQSKKGSDQGNEMARQDQQPASNENQLGRAIEALMPAKTSFDHPNWILDRVTHGTWPESTQVAMGRQFARVLGDMLGKQTKTTEEAKALLQQGIATGAEVDDPKKHLFDAIDTVTQSRTMIIATENLVQSMGKNLDGLPVQIKLGGVHALMRGTVAKMFNDMMDSPQDPKTMRSVSGDESMHTVFGVHGKVEKMSIKMAAGRLSHYFKESLVEAQRSYDEKKAALRNGGVVRNDDVFELTFTVERQDSKTNEIRSEILPVKTTKEDLVASYMHALREYASDAYATRVRKAINVLE